MLEADRNGIEYATPLKFNTPFTYVTHDATAAIGGSNYFFPLRDMLKVGDEIRVSCLKGSSWQKAVFEVVSSKVAVKSKEKTKTTPAEVIVHQITKWRRGGPD